jgi:hypothetical protein
VAPAWETPGVIPARLAAAAALVGGLLWIAHAVLGGGSDPVPATLHFVGLGFVLVASAIFGSSLVKSDAVAMRVVVGLASGLLALSLVEAFRVTDSGWYDGFWASSPRSSAASPSCAAAASSSGRHEPAAPTPADPPFVVVIGNPGHLREVAPEVR